MREELTAMMGADRRKMMDTDFMVIQYKPASKRSRIDSKKLKQRYPYIYEECAKTAEISPYVVCKLKRDAMLL